MDVNRGARGAGASLLVWCGLPCQQDSEFNTPVCVVTFLAFSCAISPYYPLFLLLSSAIPPFFSL